MFQGILVCSVSTPFHPAKECLQKDTFSILWKRFCWKNIRLRFWQIQRDDIGSRESREPQFILSLLYFILPRKDTFSILLLKKYSPQICAEMRSVILGNLKRVLGNPSLFYLYSISSCHERTLFQFFCWKNIRLRFGQRSREMRSIVLGNLKRVLGNPSLFYLFFISSCHKRTLFQFFGRDFPGKIFASDLNRDRER